MSVIRYRFKSSKDFDSVSFDGHGIPVWELKEEIITSKKLGKASSQVDFDLILTNAQTNEDYVDDNQIIPKNTSVLVRRVPRTAPGGRPPLMRGPPSFPGSAGQGAPGRPPSFGTPGHHQYVRPGLDSPSSVPTGRPEEGEEQRRIQAMAQESSDMWNRQQELQSTYGNDKSFRRAQSAAYGGPQHQPIPAPSYICYRCGEKGHYIYYCPLASSKPNDQNRIRRVTGIPKSFLQPAQNSDLKKTMISYDGSLVVVKPNDREWAKFHANATAFADSGHSNEMDDQSNPPLDGTEGD